jgi:large subunit ribosomal protein L1
MKSLWKIARTLWQKGLMPSPKAWTVTQDFERAIWELKKWRVEFKTDKTWIIHVAIWKVSFWWEKILENLKTIVAAVLDKKPTSIKNAYINSVSLCTSMWPWVSVDVNEAYSVNK